MLNVICCKYNLAIHYEVCEAFCLPSGLKFFTDENGSITLKANYDKLLVDNFENKKKLEIIKIKIKEIQTIINSLDEYNNEN